MGCPGWRALGVGLLLAAPGPAFAASASPEALALIRQNYTQVSELVAQGQLLQLRRTFACTSGGSALRVVWKDGSGVTRKYQFQDGTSDSAVSYSQFYGPDGRLSFALIEAGAVNGTKQETRLYYGPAGNVIRFDEKTVLGPGYPFGPLWQEVVPLPDVAFNAPPC